ncbi:MAG: hypothetical protein ACJ0F5_04150, partial [Candidatus Actinomarina sp.]
MSKKAIVSLLVLSMVAVACAAETTEEVAVEEEHDHSDESTLEMVLERGFVKCGVSGSATAFSETGAD